MLNNNALVSMPGQGSFPANVWVSHRGLKGAQGELEV